MPKNVTDTLQDILNEVKAAKVVKEAQAPADQVAPPPVVSPLVEELNKLADYLRKAPEDTKITYDDVQKYASEVMNAK